ncbi:MAG: hypothetical protein Q9173_003705, partial [Seirophora scorigena]
MVEGMRSGGSSAGPVQAVPVRTSHPDRVGPPNEPNAFAPSIDPAIVNVSAQALETRNEEELVRVPGGVIDQSPPRPEESSILLRGAV